MNLRLLIAVFMGVILIISTGMVLVSTGPTSLGGSSELKPLEGYFPLARFTYPLGTGSVVELKFESSAILEGEEREESGLLKLSISGFSWPEVNIDFEAVEGDAEGPGVITFSQLALPRELLGLSEIALPVYVPGVDAGECLAFRLIGEEDGVLIYQAAAEIGDYVVKVEAGYYSDTGVLSYMEIFLVGPDSRVKYRHEVVSYESSGEELIEAGWLCSPSGMSSDFRYVREGLALVEGTEIVYIEPEEFRQAIQGDAVYLVLDKRCPFCQIDWSHILKASEEVEVPFYAVIAGPLLGEDERRVAVLEMNKAGVVGTPAFVAYKNGKIVDVRQGFMDWREIVEWVRSVYG